MTTTMTPVYSQWNLPTIDNANANDKRGRADNSHNTQQIQLQQPSLVVSPSDDHSHSHSHSQNQGQSRNQDLSRPQPSPLHLSPHHAYARDSVQTIKSAVSAVSSTRTLRNSGRYAPSVFTFNANWAPAPLSFSSSGGGSGGGASTSTSAAWDQRYLPRPWTNNGANNRTEVAGDGLVDVERVSHLDFDSDSDEDGLPVGAYNNNWHSKRSRNGYGNGNGYLHEEVEEDDYSNSPGPTPTQARTNPYPYPYPGADADDGTDTDANSPDPYAIAKLNAAYLASYGYTNGLGYERPPSSLSLSNRSGSESTSSPSEYSKFSYRDEEKAYGGLEGEYLYENAGNSKLTYPHQSSSAYRNTGARFPPPPPHAWFHSLNKATSALLSSLSLDTSLRDDPYEAWEALCWDEAAPESEVSSVNNDDFDSNGQFGIVGGVGGAGVAEGRREGRVYADAGVGRRGGIVGVDPSWGTTTKVPYEDPTQEWREFLSSESLPSLDPPVFAPIYEEDDETEVDVDVGLGVNVGAGADANTQTHLNSNTPADPPTTIANNNTNSSTAIKRTTTMRSASTSESGSRSMTTTSNSTVTGGTGGESSEEWISLTGARAQAARARILPSRAFARMDLEAGTGVGTGDLEVHAPLPTQVQMDTSILASNPDACAESSQTQMQQHTRTPVDPILVRTPPLHMAYTENNNNYGVVGEGGTFGVGRESLEQFGIMMEGMVGEEGETAPHYGECERDQLVTSSMSMSIPLPIPMPTTMEGEGIRQEEGEGEEGRDHPPPYEASVCASGFEMGVGLSVPQDHGDAHDRQTEREVGAETASSAPADTSIIPERSTGVSTPQPASPHLHPLTRPSPASTPTPQISLALPKPSPSPAPASASTLTGHRHDGHERTRSQLTFPTSPTTTNTTSDDSSNSQYSRHSRYGRRQSQSVPTLLTSPHSLHSPISPYSPHSPRSPYSPYSPYSPTSASNETETETTLITPSGTNSNANMVFASLFSGSSGVGLRSTTGSGSGGGIRGGGGTGEGIGYSPGPASASFKGSRAGGVFGIGKGESASANGGSRPSSPFSILSPITPSRSGGFNFNFGHHTSTSSSVSQKDKEKQKEKQNSNLRVGARPRGARTTAGTWLSASAAGPYDSGMSAGRAGRVSSSGSGSGSGSRSGGNTSSEGEVGGSGRGGGGDGGRREGWTSAPASSSDFNFYGPVNGGGMGVRVRVSREVIRETSEEEVRDVIRKGEDVSGERKHEGRREVNERRAKTPGPTPVVLPLQRERRKEEWELVEPPLREMSKSTPPMFGPGPKGLGGGGVGGPRNLSTSTFTVFADASSRANANTDTDTGVEGGWRSCSAEDLPSETTFSQHPHQQNQNQNQDQNQTRNRSSSSVSNANTTLSTTTNTTNNTNTSNTNASNTSNSSSKTLQRFASRCGTISRRIGVVAGVGVVSTKDWWRTN